ncbi:putative baseplate assembly protein [Nitrincola sp. A-D6]|uniref:putative baseplate assembly protein n=1 Tax=Nitrincola sp. A-D6 TaxID=1545442 RepID=UPI00068D05FC|nr:putative baseplate assembly protein [Nitrincola sp. A-D6]
MPSTATGVRLSAASADAWKAMGLMRSPRSADELIAFLGGSIDGVNVTEEAERLKQALSVDLLLQMGVEEDTAGLLSDCADAQALADALQEKVNQGDELNPAAIPQEVWGSLVPIFAAPDVPGIEDPDTGEPVYLPLYFIRATLEQPESRPRLLNQLRLNVVRGTAASTRKDERLGVSTGRPGQRLRLTRAPVAIDPNTGAPDLDLTVTINADVQVWQRVTDFHGHGPADRVYLLDAATGEIRFGDGRPKGVGGAIPPNGSIIRAARYRFGGGRVANVARGTITKIKGALAQVKSVSNPRAAYGGADGETLDEVRRRAPSTLRRRERAVSASDFADLARETPGAAIHSAYAIAAKAPTADGFTDRPGAVSVVVLPDIDHPTPQPDAAMLAAVRGWLDPRRLVTTELHVLGPRYFNLTRLGARLTVSADADFASVTDAARLALVNWLHPIRGGAEGKGWPFGTDIYHADLYSVLLAVPGIKRVSRLHLEHDFVAGGSPADVVPVPEGLLPALQPGAIGFEVDYG